MSGPRGWHATAPQDTSSREGAPAGNRGAPGLLEYREVRPPRAPAAPPARACTGYSLRLHTTTHPAYYVCLNRELRFHQCFLLSLELNLTSFITDSVSREEISELIKLIYKGSSFYKRRLRLESKLDIK